MVVFDVTNEETFINLQYWYEVSCYAIMSNH